VRDREARGEIEGEGRGREREREGETARVWEGERESRGAPGS